MQMKPSSRRDWRWPLLAFLLSGGAALFAFAAFGVYPFGELTVATADMNNQYLHFHTFLRRALLSGDGLLYSFEAGLGTGTLPLYAYYLASPLALLVLLFPAAAITEAMFLITVLKIALCGAAYALFAQRVLKADGRSTLLFAPAYALCAYVACYASNIMWLDALYLLPLVLLATEHLLVTRRLLPLCLALAALFFTQFYLAYMAGIFTFLWLVAALWSRRVQRPWGILGRFLGATALAAGLCAATLLPTALRLLANSAVQANILAFAYNYIADVPATLARCLFGGFDTIRGGGAAPLYVGTAALVLLPAYFANRAVPGRQRIAAGVLLALLLGSLFSPMLTYVWQAFDFAAWFQYRYAFVLALLLVVLAHQAFLQLDHTPAWLLAASAVLVTALPLLLQGALPESIAPAAPWLALGLGVIWGGLLLVLRRPFPARAAVAWACVALLLAELSGNFYLTLRGIDAEAPYRVRAELRQSLDQRAAHLAEVVPRPGDDPFRVEVSEVVTEYPNEQLALGYMGMQTFSSTANVENIAQYIGLGMLSTGYIQHHIGSNLALDSLLGIRAIVGGDGSAEENDYAFPLAFVTPRAGLSYTLPPPAYVLRDGIRQMLPNNIFERHNELFHALFGPALPDDIFVPVAVASATPEALIVEPVEDEGTRLALDPDADGLPTLHYTLAPATENAALYAYFAVRLDSGEAHLEVNGQPFAELSPNQRSLNVALPEFVSDQFDLVLDEEFTVLDSQLVYALDLDALSSYSEAAYDNGLWELRWGNRGISGLAVAEGDDQAVFLSIPYDGGWRATVDSQAVAVEPALGLFCAVPVPAGEHQISLTYTPPGFTLGLAISALSLVIFITLAAWPRLRRRKEGATV